MKILSPVALEATDVFGESLSDLSVWEDHGHEEERRQERRPQRQKSSRQVERHGERHPERRRKSKSPGRLHGRKKSGRRLRGLKAEINLE